MNTTRRLAAILAADVVGYSRLMGVDEVATLQALKTHRREVVDPAIAAYHGRIVKTTGDGMLVEFASAVDAVNCAMTVQKSMADRNDTSAPDANGSPSIVFRIGINVGDIIIDGDDIFGDGVNVAARVEAECEPGGVCLSANTFEQIRSKTSFAFDDMGERQLKNIERPVRIYSARVGGPTVTSENRDTPSLLDTGKPLPLPDKPSIAVLPFQNMSGDPEQEYFADGMVEDIITALSQFKSLFVIARNSSFTYKGKAAVDIKQVGRELGVRYVLEGSVRKSGSRVRITSQLIEAGSGAHLWADRLDGSLENIFDLQDQVTTKVAGAIAPTLEKAEIDRAKRRPTESSDAYDYFLRGMAIYYRYSKEASSEALHFFYRAIEADPDFVLAYARAAIVYAQRKQSSWMEDAEHETNEGMRLARRSAELGRDDAFALGAAGFTLAFLGWQLDQGAALIDQALVLNSNSALVWQASGWVRIYLGEPEVAVEHLQRALRLSPADPDAPQIASATSWALINAGRYEEAISWADKALFERPTFMPALRMCAICNALAGRIETAQRTVAIFRQHYPEWRIRNFPKGLLRRPDDYAKFVEGLRKAGMPE